LNKDIPILAICRGMQLLNVALGGKLLQDIPGHRSPEGGPEFHDIHIMAESRLARIIGMSGDIKVNSRHHQAVHPSNKAAELIAAAYRTEDGVIEALESNNHTWVIGVQSHPQRKNEMPEGFQNLFTSFVQAARRSGR
ncbi:MAG: gamma-glutamyl-gamma-aminobutyrate hydrolase family protein, partial [Dehalococcoidia bacterium]|nr:gamma-glutamyl-gamma-aminobutyrate hydrolase family protein [Dehalococcoidia bacterium]